MRPTGRNRGTGANRNARGRGQNTNRGRGNIHPGTRSQSIPTRGAGRGAAASRSQMENIASISRSSGLEKDGNALKNPKTQEEYRAFIEEKLIAFWSRYAGKPDHMLSESELRQKKESQENIMILFRKLREGLSSIKRRDKFAIEGYETSLHLSVIFDAPVQTTSILSHLIPDMYQITKSAGPSNSDLNRLASVLICLLHHLVMAYPSQQTFRDQLETISPLLLDCSSPAYVWITSLARSLRLLDYVKFDEMSRPSSFDEFVFASHNSLPTIQTQQTPERPSKSPTYDLPRAAVYSLVKRLRMKMREKTWLILRSAYREMSTADETREWFSRTLLLTSVYPETRITSMEEWMAARAKAGDVRPKEGMEGRWIINKVR